MKESNTVRRAVISEYILVAEDNPINTIYVRKLLEKYGFRVDLAKDGNEVVAKWKNSGTYDLILMDVQMPVADGIQATTKIRSIEKRDGKSPIPIIALTAYGTSEEKDKMLAVGADNYITKPIDIQNLLSVIAVTRKMEPPHICEGTDSPEEHYERKLLREFRDVEGTLGEMLRMTLREFPQRLSEIDRSLSSGDFDTAAENCHSLANVAGILRADELRDKAVYLEGLFRNGNDSEKLPQVTRPLFESIEKRASELMLVFEKLLEGNLK
ncbi:MAG: response regulator [Sediminispirochaetaceae bacterium]